MTVFLKKWPVVSHDSCTASPGSSCITVNTRHDVHQHVNNICAILFQNLLFILSQVVGPSRRAELAEFLHEKSKRVWDFVEMGFGHDGTTNRLVVTDLGDAFDKSPSYGGSAAEEDACGGEESATRCLIFSVTVSHKNRPDRRRERERYRRTGLIGDSRDRTSDDPQHEPAAPGSIDDLQIDLRLSKGAPYGTTLSLRQDFRREGYLAALTSSPARGSSWPSMEAPAGVDRRARPLPAEKSVFSGTFLLELAHVLFDAVLFVEERGTKIGDTARVHSLRLFEQGPSLYNHSTGRRGAIVTTALRNLAMRYQFTLSAIRFLEGQLPWYVSHGYLARDARARERYCAAARAIREAINYGQTWTDSEVQKQNLIAASVLYGDVDAIPSALSSVGGGHVVLTSSTQSETETDSILQKLERIISTVQLPILLSAEEQLKAHQYVCGHRAWLSWDRYQC